MEEEEQNFLGAIDAGELSRGRLFLPAPILQRVLVISTSRSQRARHHYSTDSMLGHTAEYRSTADSFSKVSMRRRHCSRWPTPCHTSEYRK